MTIQELREQILDTIACGCLSSLDYPCKCEPHFKEQCWGKVTDQILSLDGLLIEVEGELPKEFIVEWRDYDAEPVVVCFDKEALDKSGYKKVRPTKELVKEAK